MEGDTVVITAQDIVNHTVYSRKKSETKFRLDFLLRHGAKEDDLHVQALSSSLSQIGERLSPLEEKMSQVDMVALVPHKSRIDALNREIASFAQEDIDRALSEKEGAAYLKLKERAAITKANYENREEIARLTLLANALPGQEAEGIRRLAETEEEGSVELSGLAPDKRLEVLMLLNRIGVCVALEAERAVRSSEAGEGGEVERIYENGRRAWIAREKLAEFDANEEELNSLNRKLQKLNALKQARPLEESEHEEFLSSQAKYLEAIDRRKGFLKEARLGLSKIELKKQKEKISEVMEKISQERGVSDASENARINDEVREAVSEILSEGS